MLSGVLADRRKTMDWALGLLTEDKRQHAREMLAQRKVQRPG